MALAVIRGDGTDYATVAGEGLAVQAKFRNPAMPSVASQASSTVQMISVLPWHNRRRRVACCDARGERAVGL